MPAKQKDLTRRMKSVRLNEREKSMLIEIAKRLGVKQSEVIRRLIEIAFNNPRFGAESDITELSRQFQDLTLALRKSFGTIEKLLENQVSLVKTLAEWTMREKPKKR